MLSPCPRTHCHAGIPLHAAAVYIRSVMVALTWPMCTLPAPGVCWAFEWAGHHHGPYEPAEPAEPAEMPAVGDANGVLMGRGAGIMG